WKATPVYRLSYFMLPVATFVIRGSVWQLDERRELRSPRVAQRPNSDDRWCQSVRGRLSSSDASASGRRDRVPPVSKGRPAYSDRVETSPACQLGRRIPKGRHPRNWLLPRGHSRRVHITGTVGCA